MESGENELIGAILEAYRSGAFPMAASRDAAQRGEPIGWYRPETRAILPLVPEALGLSQGVHIPRRLARTVRQKKFRISADTAFRHVVEACAAPRPDTESMTSETWIDDRIIGAFSMLYEAGHAHSIEAWKVEEGLHRLVGGVYGLAVGGVFCAESMFSRPAEGGRDASKVALVHLIEHCRNLGFSAIDTQMTNPHLEQFGVVEVPIEVYLDLLEEVGEREIRWGPLEG